MPYFRNYSNTSQECHAKLGGPRTPSRSADTNLDCANLKNALLFSVPKIGSARAPVAHLYDPSLSKLMIYMHSLIMMFHVFRHWNLTVWFLPWLPQSSRRCSSEDFKHRTTNQSKSSMSNQTLSKLCFSKLNLSTNRSENKGLLELFNAKTSRFGKWKWLLNSLPRRYLNSNAISEAFISLYTRNKIT